MLTIVVVDAYLNIFLPLVLTGLWFGILNFVLRFFMCPVSKYFDELELTNYICHCYVLYPHFMNSYFSGDTDAVVPVTATRYSIDALKLQTITNWYPWYDNGKVSGQKHFLSNQKLGCQFLRSHLFFFGRSNVTIIHYEMRWPLLLLWQLHVPVTQINTWYLLFKFWLACATKTSFVTFDTNLVLLYLYVLVP